MKRLLYFLVTILGLSISLAAPLEKITNKESIEKDFNPFDPQVDETLRAFDEAYEKQTGESPFLRPHLEFSPLHRSCYRESCSVWAQIVKSKQRMYLYINGRLKDTFRVSTGKSGYRTPNFDNHPDGRVYRRFVSTTFPGGDYKGLGNMPYAVFLYSGFAIHGALPRAIRKLGRTASHGCIRLHPDHAKYFNQLVRKYGVEDVWITVHD